MAELMMKKKKMAMSCSCSSSSSSYLFRLVKEDIIVETVLLKLPVSSLLRLRCVSRYFHSLITSPSFIKKHLDHNSAQLNHNHNLLLISSVFIRPLFHGVKMAYSHCAVNFSTNDGGGGDDEVVEMHCPFESSGIQASCNGLLLLHRITNDTMYHGYIWNPCTKEYKELPPPTPPSTTPTPPLQRMEDQRVQLFSSGFCGFGYDCTNDEYKILYYENRTDSLVNGTSVSISEFKLYKLGTNTWTSVSHNPYRSFTFGVFQKIAVFVNGALHWIMSSSHLLVGGRNTKIISFDMEKEEFREIQKPYPSTVATSYGGLQVLQGCLCLCEFPSSDLNTTTYIWMLKDYAVKDSWTKLFTVVVSRDSYAMRHFRLLRLCENGEIVMKINHHNYMIVYDPVKQISRRVENLNKKEWTYEVIYTIVYDPVKQISRRVENLNKKEWTYEVIYTESLVPLNSGTYLSSLHTGSLVPLNSGTYLS